MSDTTVYLITGANRGIGLELVKAYSSDSKNIIIAGVRDPSSATALHELSKTAAAKIHITKIDSADEAGNRAAAKEIEEVFGRVDVLWANAGIASSAPALTETIEQYELQFRINTLGPVVLFQSFYPLLLKSTKREKKFIITSTALGSQTLGGFSNTAAYGMAKAAVNNFGVRVHKDHSEKDKIVVVLVHPGLVASDMNEGLKAGDSFPWGEMTISVLSTSQSAEYIKAVEQNATLESHGGKYLNYDGSPLPW